jgi:hypothetical protein
VKRDVDRAIAFGTVATVALVPTVMMVGLTAGTGFSGGTTGGPIIPAAGEAPGPGPEQSSPSSTPPTKAPLAPLPNGKKPSAAGTPQQPPKDTGGSRSFTRVIDRSLNWYNGTGSYSDEKAKIVLSPFSYDATTVTKTTGGGRTTTDTTRVTVIGKVKTTVENGIQTERRTLSATEYAAFVQSCDPTALTSYARSFPAIQRKPGIEVLNFKRGPGAEGFETDTLSFTLGAILPYLPKSVATQVDVPPFNTEGLSGYLVADKWNRPWAMGVSQIALPIGVANLGILFLGYQK